VQRLVALAVSKRCFTTVAWLQQDNIVSLGGSVRRLDIKLMEPTVFAVCPLTANQDVPELMAWLAASNLRYHTRREGWQWYTRCACRGKEHCIHYVLYLHFATRGDAMIFKLAWM
jgi:hypothetical protein